MFGWKFKMFKGKNMRSYLSIGYEQNLRGSSKSSSLEQFFFPKQCWIHLRAFLLIAHFSREPNQNKHDSAGATTSKSCDVREWQLSKRFYIFFFVYLARFIVISLCSVDDVILRNRNRLIIIKVPHTVQGGWVF